MNLLADTIFWTTCIGLVSLWVVYFLCLRSWNRFARQVQQTCKNATPNPETHHLNKEESSAALPLTIVLTAHNQQEALQRNLPSLLEQDYPNFEIVVVDMASSDDTLAYLETQEKTYPYLSHTFRPGSARYISSQRLGITLGIRAATHEHVVITRPDCIPLNQNWLSAIAQEWKAHAQAEVMLGYINFRQTAKRMVRKIAFRKLWHTQALLSHAMHHAAYTGDAAFWGIQRSAFLQGPGFYGHNYLLSGAEEILINRISTKHNTGVWTHPDTFMTQEVPTAIHLWKQERVFYNETRRHFLHTWLFRFKKCLLLLLPWVMTLYCIAMLVGIGLLHTDLVALGIVCAIFVGFWATGAAQYNKAARTLNTQPAYISFPFRMGMLGVWELSAWCSYKHKDRREFRKKIV